MGGVGGDVGGGGAERHNHKAMARTRYTAEQRAQAVAEFWLVGSQRRVAETLGIGDHKTVGQWVREAESPVSPASKKMADRAKAIREARQTNLEELYQRALDLQLRDLEQAGFRDRTGLIKIVGEQRLLAQGRPTSIQEARSTSQMDAEIADLLKQLPPTTVNGSG